ncbi:MAG: hypothetical protein LBL35_07150 [Clostridiales bacterium]|jgi:hypothetical protein|nr:hypothetical protein [Clostridiales bacterium]
MKKLIALALVIAMASMTGCGQITSKAVSDNRPDVIEMGAELPLGQKTELTIKNA